MIAGVTGPDVYLDTPNVYLIKTDSSGNMVWNRTCGEGGVGFSVVQTSDRGYVIAGYKSVELGASWRGNDVYLLKLTPLEICSGTKPTAMALGILLFNHLIADT